MFTDLEAKLGPFTKNNVCSEILEEFYDFSDASNYKLTTGVAGIALTGINPNMTFPQKTISDAQAGGLRLLNQTLDLSLFSKKSFTICVVMQLWLNRSMSIKTDLSNGAYEKPHLIYDHATKKLKLQTNGSPEVSLTVPNSFSCKRVGFWLTKNGTGFAPVVKASISNKSSTLTQQSNLTSQSNYKVKMFSQDAVIYKVMHTQISTILIPNNTAK